MEDYRQTVFDTLFIERIADAVMREETDRRMQFQSLHSPFGYRLIEETCRVLSTRVHTEKGYQSAGVSLGKIHLHPVLALRTENSIAQSSVIVCHKQDRNVDARAIHLGDNAIGGPINIRDQRYLIGLVITYSAGAVSDLSHHRMALRRRPHMSVYVNYHRQILASRIDQV